MPEEVRLDAADLAAEPVPGGRALGGEVDEDGDWHRVLTQAGRSADGAPPTGAGS